MSRIFTLMELDMNDIDIYQDYFFNEKRHDSNLVS